MENNFETEFYDVVIDAKSFEDLRGSGWNVQMSKTAQEPLDEYDKTKLIEELKNNLAKAKIRRVKEEREIYSKKQNKTLIHILSMING